MKSIGKVLSFLLCFVLAASAVSSYSVASALVSDNLVNHVQRVMCPLCFKIGFLTIDSYTLATDSSPGRVSFSCAACGKSSAVTTQYWGSDYFNNVRYLKVFDVLLFTCPTSGEIELGFYRGFFQGNSPTCTSGGFIGVIHLGNCGAAYMSSMVSVGSWGHVWDETGRISSTCTTPGSVSATCSRCNATKAEPLPALGHDYITTRTDPTCTAPGSIVTTCSRCNDTETETLPVLGHDYSVTARNDPTCAAPGSVTSTCSRCNDEKIEELPPSYHSWDSAEMVPSVYNENGDIVTEGYTFYTCSSCGSSYTAVAGTSPPAAGPVSDSIGGSGMSDTTAALGKTFLSGIWSLFGISVPGFGFTFGQMWLGVLLCSVSILVIRIIFGFGGGPRGDAPRTSSTSNPRISKERRRDEF